MLFYFLLHALPSLSIAIVSIIFHIELVTHMTQRSTKFTQNLHYPKTKLKLKILLQKLVILNLVIANPTKWSNTFKQFFGNSRSQIKKA